MRSGAFSLSGDIEVDIKQVVNDIDRISKEIDKSGKDLKEYEEDWKKVEDTVKGVSDEMAKDTKKGTEESKSAMDKLKDAPDEVKDGFEGLKNAMLAAFAAVGTFLAASVKGATDYKQALNQVQASTGSTAEETEALGQVMQGVYKNNYGEDWQDVGNAIAEVNKQLWLTGDELQSVTEKAFGIRDTFGAEVPESVRAAKTLMKQFGVTGDEAMNLITQGYQSNLDFSGEFLDSINEYSVHFAQIGLDAEDMFNVFLDGSAGGAFNLDKIGDAVKELGIRTQDMSDTTRDAYKSLGLDIKSTEKAFAEGGEAGKEAFYKIIEGLAGINDPLERNRVGVELFGTMWEDLGEDTIFELAEMSDGFNRTVESADQLNQVKYDDFGSAMQGIGRTLQTDLLVPMGEKLLPKLNEFADWLQNEGIPMITGFVDGIVDNLNIIIPIVSTIVGAFMTFKTIEMILNAVTMAQWLWNAAMAANPVVLITLAVAALIGILVALVMNWDWVKEKASELWESLKTWFSEGWEYVKTKTSEAIDAIINWFVSLPERLSEAMALFSEWLMLKWEKIKLYLTTKVSEIINAVVTFFSELPYKIGYALGYVIAAITTWGINMYNWVITNIPIIINNIITWFASLPGRIWSWLVNVINRIIAWGTQMYYQAITWMSNFINACITWISQLPGNIWNWLLQALAKVKAWGIQLVAKGVEAAKEFGQSIVDYVKELPGKFLQLGKDIVKGVVNGIKGAKDWALGQVSNFFSGIVDGAKDFLGIHSPSRVMRDEVGKFMAQGIGVGFEDEEKDINLRVQKSLASTVDFAKDSIDSSRSSSYSTDRLGQVVDLLTKILNKDGNVYLDGRELATGISPYGNDIFSYGNRYL